MRWCILILACVTSALAVTSKGVVDEEWETFKLKYKKSYNSAVEELFRKRIFLENKLKVAKHNKKYIKGEYTYDIGINEYSDLLSHEFVSRMNGFQRNYRERRYNGSTYIGLTNVNIPDEVDWRKEGYVTEVKNQGECGACYTFSTTGALEGQHFRKTGKLVSLSEQNLLDCSKDYGNEGCDGGLMDQTFEYIKDNKGVDTEESYPYKAVEGKCHFSKKTVGATDTGFVDVPTGDEEKLKEALATIGPISVAIDASKDSFQAYTTGVYVEPECSSSDLDHAVLAVGYGTEGGQDYWLIKNSWGPGWGEEGYIKMARNKDNQCGVATSASYPSV